MGGIKPFSQACINNRQPILEILERAFSDASRVLEIGSGTGQHSVYFAPRLRHLRWQTSDRRENLSGIHAWIEAEPSENLLHPLELDVCKPWPKMNFDGFYTANTCHIMPWEAVLKMFDGIRSLSLEESTLAIYGPFKYDGQFTSDSNARFDLWLKQQFPHQGVRNIEDIIHLADAAGFGLLEDFAMPANNQLLIFRNF